MPENTTSDMMSLEDFILQPTTAGFVIRGSGFSEAYLEARPDIRIGTRLTGNYIVAYTKGDNIIQILQDIGASNSTIHSMVMGLLAQPALDAAGITEVQQQPYLHLTGRGTLMAFIDTGIDYTQDAFRYEDGTTKVLYLWDQTIRGNPPEGFYFGTEYTSEEINQALGSPDPYSIVPQRDTVGHGTFLASVAASREPGNYQGVAPDADLIVVKLKGAGTFYRDLYLVPPEQENAYESSDLMLGIEYAIKKAVEMNRPISFCISLGTNLGGHDGSSILEEYLSRLSYLPGVSICTAAGNEAIARHHMMGSVAQVGDTYDIGVISGDNEAPIYMSIINNAPDLLSVSIISPNGEVLERIPAQSGITFESGFVLERSSVIVRYFFPVELTLYQLTVVKIIRPAAGIWTIRVHGDTILDGTFHAWLPITGFVSPQIEFLTPTPNFTICTPSAAIGAVSCGAYNSTNNSLYPQSSWGPTRRPSVAPDLVAPGVNVQGIFPTGPGTMSGTSVSCAITAGATALMLQWGIVEQNSPSMNAYLIRSALIRGAIRDPTQSYPSPQWGFGRLDLMNTFRLMGVL